MLKYFLLLSLGLTMLFSSTPAKDDLQKIAEYEYRKSYEKLDAQEKQRVESKLRVKLIVHRLAKESSISQNKIYKKRVQRAKDSILMNMYLQEKKESMEIKLSELKSYYRKNIRDYTNVHAYTIVRSTPKKLLEYVKILNETSEDKLETKFKELAKKYSQHPRKSSGGDMGFIGYDSMVQPFGREAFKLQEKKFTQKPIKTVLGYHLIYVSERRVVEFEKLKKQIENTLVNQKYKKWFDNIVK